MSNSNGNQGSVLSGSLWMIVISVLLFWLPGVGGFISGLVGGKVSGGIGSALLAWLLSSILFGVLFAAFGTLLTGMVAIGLIAGLGGLFIAFIDAGARLLGAIIGGLLACSRSAANVGVNSFSAATLPRNGADSPVSTVPGCSDTTISSRARRASSIAAVRISWFCAAFEAR
mgnify:CR=1 FL=1